MEAPGFKRYVQQNFQVDAGERVGLDIELQLGQISETVTVTAEAPMLDTTTATAGQVISSSQVENMPMNGRTPLSLAQLAFGVVPNSDPKFNRPFDNAGPSGFSHRKFFPKGPFPALPGPSPAFISRINRVFRGAAL